MKILFESANHNESDRHYCDEVLHRIFGQKIKDDVGSLLGPSEKVCNTQIWKGEFDNKPFEATLDDFRFIMCYPEPITADDKEITDILLELSKIFIISEVKYIWREPHITSQLITPDTKVNDIIGDILAEQQTNRIRNTFNRYNLVTIKDIIMMLWEEEKTFNRCTERDSRSRLWVMLEKFHIAKSRDEIIERLNSIWFHKMLNRTFQFDSMIMKEE